MLIFSGKYLALYFVIFSFIILQFVVVFQLFCFFVPGRLLPLCFFYLHLKYSTRYCFRNTPGGVFYRVLPKKKT